MSKILGLDVGIGSLGWAIIDEDARRIVDLGVRIFESGEEGATDAAGRASQIRRSYRSTKRLNKRRKHRNIRLKSFIEELNIISVEDINCSYKTKGFNPDTWRYRSEGISRKLSPIELASVLINLSNYRGYRDFYEDDEEDSGKLAVAKNRINTIYEEKKDQYRTIGQMIYNEPCFRDERNGKLVIRNRAIRGTDGKKETNYVYLINRSTLIDELKVLLSCQREFGYEQLTDDAIDKICSIIFVQRDFEDGPGPNKAESPERRESMMKSLKGHQSYSGFDELVGNCSFYPTEGRGHKNSQLYDMYVVINTLSQLRFYCDNKEVNCPESVVMEIRLQLFENGGSLSKKHLEKICKDHKIEVSFPGELSKKKVIIKAPYIKILTDDHLFDVDFMQQFKEENYYDDCSLSSKIGLAIAKYATPRRRKDEIKNNVTDEEYNRLGYADGLKTIKSLGVSNVSFKYMKEAISAYLNGIKYGDFQADFIKNNIENDEKKFLSNDGKLLPINDPDMVRNPVVYRTINETRKIVNAVMGLYKDIKTINIEIARDIGKSFEQRKETAKYQKENENSNEELRAELLRKLYSEGYSVMLSDRLLDKYKLWKDQKHMCMYSGKEIQFKEIVAAVNVQIEHIVPQSIILDETLNNKVLVLTEENQKKNNRLPLEYMDSSQAKGFKNRVNNLYRTNNINRIKYEYLMLESLTDDVISGFVDRNINDTRTISKYVSNYLRLSFNGDVTVNVIKGSVTSRFRRRWLGTRSKRYDGVPSVYGLEQKTRKLHYYHHAIDAAVVANLTRPYIEIAQDYLRIESIRKDAEYHAKKGNSKTSLVLYDELEKEKAKSLDKIHHFYGFNREYTRSLLDSGFVPSICKDFRSEIEIRVPLEITFDAFGYTQMEKSYRSLRNNMDAIKSNLTDADIEAGTVIVPNMLEDINSDLPIVCPEAVCIKPNAQIVFSDKDFDPNADSDVIRKQFDKFTKNLSPRDVMDYIEDIRMVTEDEYATRVKKYYSSDPTFAERIKLPYVSFKISKKFRGNMVASDNPIALKKTGFNTYIELENDIKNNLKSPYYVRFNKGINESGNFTIYDARSYYCIEIFIDDKGTYQIRGIRYVDVVHDSKRGKLRLLKPLPLGYKHVMYLFKNEYIISYDKKGNIKNNGFGAYRGVENINRNTGKIRLFSNMNLSGRDNSINLAGACSKIEISILGHIMGMKKCGDQSLFITEKS